MLANNRYHCPWSPNGVFVMETMLLNTPGDKEMQYNVIVSSSHTELHCIIVKSM